ncbi:hypothetical protein CCMSSC00406_0006876 [Pleurotus cornucopiae]|uniref:Uncharacterized protein n=1 Tax=Pleurotus cornucopiae TaxID=5321 RepID=A0ACB7IQR4_PLECO|nr:hypothetical protein CCMSSC00406_0006876 [Pleurotus cornucopiae]
MSSERVLVTGASGYLGSHIVQTLLNSGYNIRATARPSKVANLQASYTDAYNTEDSQRVQVAPISDLVHGEFPEIFEGIDALIHVASPLAGREDPDSTIKTAVEGTLNMLRQAEKAGISRIVVTSSIATALNKVAETSDATIKDSDWSSALTEDVIKTGNPLLIYCFAKTAAEKAVWEFADAHPHVDITTINPPFLYGPFAPTQKFPTFDPSALSTVRLIYQIITPDGPYPPNADHTDVRDAAKAHVLALKAPPSSLVGRKRIFIASPHGLNFATITHFIAEKRPALKDRLTQTTPPTMMRDRAPVDFARIEQVLGLKKTDFHDVEGTILETIDQLVGLEAVWNSAT